MNIKEKVMFDGEEFEEGFEKYISDCDYWTYDATYETISDSLKRDGIESPYLSLIEPLKSCKIQEYLLANDSNTELEEIKTIDVINNYLNDYCDEKLQNPEYARAACAYLQKQYPYDKEFFEWLNDWADEKEYELEEADEAENELERER